MRQVNIHEAKTHFSRLVEDARKGETIIVAKAGKPIARIVPFDEPVAEGEANKPGANDNPRLDMRRFGFLKGRLRVPDDFDTMHQEEIIAMFEGRE